MIEDYLYNAANVPEDNGKPRNAEQRTKGVDAMNVETGETT
jgi:hypothetical protein